jgi:hypothetical protein
MSLQYRNKSKSQLTSPTPAQAASCCVISGTHSILLLLCYVVKKMILPSKFNVKLRSGFPKFSRGGRGGG